MSESCLTGVGGINATLKTKNDASWGGDMLEEVGTTQRDKLENAGIVE